MRPLPFLLAGAIISAAIAAGDAGPRAVLSRVEPDWPTTAIARPRNAEVAVQAWVDSLGLVERAAVARPSPPFDEAALAAVRWYRFAPGSGAAAPVPVTVSFRTTD